MGEFAIVNYDYQGKFANCKDLVVLKKIGFAPRVSTRVARMHWCARGHNNPAKSSILNNILVIKLILKVLLIFWGNIPKQFIIHILKHKEIEIVPKPSHSSNIQTTANLPQNETENEKFDLKQPEKSSDDLSLKDKSPFAKTTVIFSEEEFLNSLKKRKEKIVYENSLQNAKV